jgi:hypothetical protein
LERALNLFSADKVSAESIERVAPIVTSPDFNVNSIRNKSGAAASLGQWVIDIIYAAASLHHENTAPTITRARPQTAFIPKRASPKPRQKVAKVVHPGFYVPPTRQIYTKSHYS